MPRFSIIIPVYNAEEYITDCLDSIVMQTFTDFEVIVVDDGSSDESVSIIEKYMQIDNRIFLLRRKHSNAGVARNAGLSHAIGDYVIFLDADDRFSLKLLERVAASITDKKEEILIWTGRSFDDKTGTEKDLDYPLQTDFLEGRKSFSARESAKYLYQLTSGVLWNKAFLRQFLLEQKIEFQDIMRSNDVYFVFTALSVAENIKVIEERLIFYRINNEKSLQGSLKDRSLHFYSALLKVKQELENRGLFDLFRDSFLVISLVQSVNRLNACSNGEDFAFIYHKLKNDIFIQLGIEKMEEKQYCDPWYVTVFEEINEKSAYEYLYDHFERNRTIIKVLENENNKKMWAIPYAKIPRGADVVLYGAGNMGQDFQWQITQSGYWNLIAWVDSDYLNYRNLGLPVSNPEDINKWPFQYILVAIRLDNPCREVIEYLYTKGIAKEKIVLIS